MLNRKGSIDRDQLAALLWPDDDESESRANLRRHIHHLQHALNPNGDLAPVVLRDGPRMKWNPEAPVSFDVDEFERLSASPQTLADAVEVYAGDLLDSIYEDWLIPQRERLRLLYIDSLNALVEQHRSRRDFKTAVAYTQRVLQADPWREDAIRRLMMLRFDVGDRSGALAEYLQFSRRLRNEMDLEPMPETFAAYENIRQNSTVPSQQTGPAEVEQRAEIALPFVGREESMAVLRAKWDQAARGHGSAVLISGEGGIGKSRLASELALLAESQGARFLFGAATAVESAPYDAVTQAIRAALPVYSQLKLEPTWKAALSALLPELRESGASPLMHVEPESEQLRLFEAVSQVFVALAKGRPVLLIVEDVHLAGAGSANLLAHLARRAAGASLLLIITYRSEEASRQHPIRELRRIIEQQRLGKHLALPPLSRDAVALIATSSNLSQLANEFYERSEGNPFFLSEILRLHLEGSNVSMPGSSGVSSLISARTATLSEPALALAEAAAVIGSTFDVELLKEVCEWDESAMLDALDEILDRQLIRESSAGHSDFSFRHHLIHSAIYQGCAEETRKRRHRRIARALQELHPECLSDLHATVAFHLDRADVHAEAARHYLEAALSAQALFANLEAIGLAKRGLLICSDAVIGTTLGLLLEELYARIGDRNAQHEQLTQLEHGAPLGRASGIEADILLRRIALHNCLGNREEEAAALRKLDEQSAACANDTLNASRLLAWARYYKATGTYEPAITAARQTLLLPAVQSDTASKGDALCMLAELYSGTGDYQAAACTLDEVQHLGDSGENTLSLARALRVSVRLAMDERNFPAARIAGEKLLALCERIGDQKGKANAHAGLGAAIGRSFDLAAARCHYQAAIEMYRSLGEQHGIAIVSLNEGTLSVLMGDCKAALRAYATAAALFQSLRDRRGEALCALNSSLCKLYLEDFEEAAVAARSALRLSGTLASPSLRANALANLGAAERERGEFEHAIRHMNEGITIRRMLNERVDLAADLCDLGLTYLRSLDLSSAGRVLDDLLLVNASDTEQMLFPQYFGWVKSALLRAAGRQEEARTTLIAAHEEFERRRRMIPQAHTRTTYASLPFNKRITEEFTAAG